MFVLPTNSCIESLTSQMMDLGTGGFGRWLGHESRALANGCESWTIKKAECQRIDAFELWCWRKLLIP